MASDSTSKSGPLAGLRVLDLSRLLPGPYLSLILADMGADVVKIEAPVGGDWVRWIPPTRGGLSVQFIALNRGKRSVAIDLKQPSGVDAFKRLARSADVIIESFRPGVMDRLGVGYEVLAADNPGLVYAAISGYGQTGPYRDRAGHDINYVSLSGAAAMTGRAGETPRIMGVQLGDLGGGSLFGAVSVLGALYARHNTGKGAFLDISMTEGALGFNVLGLADALIGRSPTRGTETLNGKLSCYDIYETADGKHLSVAPLEAKFWKVFCAAMERPDWLPRHMGDDERMRAELAEVLRTRTRDEWMAVFGNVDACVEPVLELDELREHPQHVARNVFFELEQPGADEPLTQFRTPVMSSEAAASCLPAPRLGEHTRAVFTAAGLSEQEIDALLSERAIVEG